jgi:hypothetical protein
VPSQIHGGSCGFIAHRSPSMLFLFRRLRVYRQPVRSANR